MGSVLWNASVAIYDPYADKIVDTLEFPGITNTGTLHIGGVARDPHTGLVSILVDAAAAWATGGADASGDNLLLRWDPAARRVLWTANLTATTRGRYSGFQDVEHDARGHTYVVGTWPSSILRVDAAGTQVVEWYLPQTRNTTVRGLGGLVALPPGGGGGDGETLLANDGDGRLLRFDLREARGRATPVPTTPDVRYSDGDGLYAPARYGGRVLLMASHAAGVQVLRSGDGWRTARHVGTVPPRTGPEFVGSAPVAAVQMGSDAVYMIVVWLGDPWVPGQVAGNRTVFPMPDITAEIDALLAKDRDD